MKINQKIIDCMLTLTQKTRIQEALIEAIEGGSKGAQFAAKCGINESYVSQIKSGKWQDAGTVVKDEHFLKLANVLHVSLEVNWKTISTSNFSRVVKICDDCKTQSLEMAIIGYSGAGKTTALKYYARSKNAGDDVFYVEVHELMNKRDFLRAILKALGEDVDRTASYMMDRVIAILQTKSNALLIVDECDELKDAHWKALKYIRNQTEHVCGIVLSGTQAFQDYLRKQTKRGVKSFDQIQRRIGGYVKLKGVLKKEIVAFCEEIGLKHTQEIVNYLHSSCKNYGMLKYVLINAMNTANRTSEIVDVEMLKMIMADNE